VCALLPSQQHAGLNSCLAHLVPTAEHVLHQQTSSRPLSAPTYHWLNSTGRCSHALFAAATGATQQVQVHGAAARQQGRGLLGSCAREGRPMLRGAQVGAGWLGGTALLLRGCACILLLLSGSTQQQQQQAVLASTAAEVQLYISTALYPACTHTQGHADQGV
jgi:hypothetical protein